jgi:hypothetical protein
MADNQQTPEQIAEQRRLARQEYKRNYQKRYYAKMKTSTEFMDKRRETTKNGYKYTRKTIDCQHCKLRHKPNSQNCLLLKQQQVNITANQIIDACNKLVDTEQSD